MKDVMFEAFAKQSYYLIKKGVVSPEFILKIVANKKSKKTTTEEELAIAKDWYNQVREGKISFDEYMSIYRSYFHD